LKKPTRFQDLRLLPDLGCHYIETNKHNGKAQAKTEELTTRDLRGHFLVMVPCSYHFEQPVNPKFKMKSHDKLQQKVSVDQQTKKVKHLTQQQERKSQYA
jgi:hypothetical protein